MDQEIINCIYNFTDIDDVNDITYKEKPNKITIWYENAISFTQHQHVLRDELSKIIKRYHLINFIDVDYNRIKHLIIIKYYNQKFIFETLPIELMGYMFKFMEYIDLKTLMLSFLDLHKIFDTVYIFNIINDLFPQFKILENKLEYINKDLFFEFIEIDKYLPQIMMSLDISRTKSYINDNINDNITYHIDKLLLLKSALLYLIKYNFICKKDELCMIEELIVKGNTEVLHYLICKYIKDEDIKVDHIFYRSICKMVDIKASNLSGLKLILSYYNIINKLKYGIVFNILNKENRMDIINLLTEYKLI